MRLQQNKIRMKSNMNKFMKHLSEDIVSENHHLKNQIIKTRKVLKSYEQTIVDQLSKLAEQMSLPIQQQSQLGYFFQSPNECLNFFIAAIRKNITRTNQLSKINKQLNNEIKQIRSICIHQQSQLNDLKSKEQNLLRSVSELQKNCKVLKNSNQTISQLYEQTKRKLGGQIQVLNQRIEKMEEEYKLKLLQQKQLITEKTNKDIAKFRVQMDTQIYQKEKAMRLENQKRDKQIRSLLNTINTIVEKKQKNGKSNPTIGEPVNRQINKTQNETQGNSASLVILTQVIKPFTEYTNLNQKLSQLRKQSLNLRNQLRQMTSSYNIAATELKEKQSQNMLLSSKIQKLILKNQQLFDELENIKDELRKSLEDKDNMEKYYNQRWNTQFNKVKHNIEKKYTDKQNSLEQQYTALKQVVSMERQTMTAQNEKFKKQSQQIRNLNKVLLTQLAVLSVQKETSKQSLKEARRKFVDIDNMHNQDKLANFIIFQEKLRHLQQIISNKDESIQILLKKIQETEVQTLKRLQNLRVQIQIQHEKQIIEIKTNYDDIIEEKDNRIQRFTNQIQSHKETIKFLQKQQGQKIEDLKKNINKQRERQIRDAKVAHYEEIGKLNEKILKNQEKIKHLKQQSVQNHIKHSNFINQKQKIITQKQSKITELQNTIKYLQGEQKTFIKDIQNLRNIRTTLEERIASLRVEINSQNLIISNKDKEIFALTKKKNQWKKDVEAVQKQFQKGFKQLNQLNDKKIQRFKSRIWELQRICEVKGISKKDYEKIRSLTQEKKKLKQQVVMKQAQNLVLTQVKNYYETKTKQLDSKMVIGFQFKNEKHPVFVRKPKRSTTQIQYIKSQVMEDLSTFTGREAVEVRKINNLSRNRDKIYGRLQTTEQSQQKQKSRSVSRSNVRVNSSLM